MAPRSPSPRATHGSPESLPVTVREVHRRPGHAPLRSGFVPVVGERSPAPSPPCELAMFEDGFDPDTTLVMLEPAPDTWDDSAFEEEAPDTVREATVPGG
jgi:hypothetical protein